MWPSALWLPLVAVVLGATPGLGLVGCMTRVELRTPVHLLAPLTAIVYCLTYVGFLMPWFISVVSLVIPVKAALA